MAMQSSTVLADRIIQLEAENKRQTIKRSKKRVHIAKGGTLTVAEAINLVERREIVQEEVVNEAVIEARKRAPSKCSMCSSTGHNARTCPSRNVAIYRFKTYKLL